MPRSEGDVDLWRVSLDCDANLLASLIKLLSDEEKKRADRFRFTKDRDRFIACRAALRTILGNYLEMEPKAINFSTGRFGKPALANGHSRIRFNVSHSHDLAVIGIVLDREIGVDVEFVDQTFDFLSVAASVFSPKELVGLATLPSHRFSEEFFQRWTRKEALLKAMGNGLSSSEKLQAELAIILDHDFVDRRFKGDSGRSWSSTSFEIHGEFKAALAIESKVGNVSLCPFEWPNRGNRQRELVIQNSKNQLCAG